jgi:hypothetical protein
VAKNASSLVSSAFLFYFFDNPLPLQLILCSLHRGQIADVAFFCLQGKNVIKMPVNELVLSRKLLDLRRDLTNKR